MPVFANFSSTPAKSLFSIDISRSNGFPSVRFLAVETDGVGYDGLERFYTLKYSSNLLGWLPVPGLTNILARDQIVTYTNTLGPLRSYRGEATLE